MSFIQVDKSTIRHAWSSPEARKENDSQPKSENDKQKSQNKGRSLYKVKIVLKWIMIYIYLIIYS